MKKTDPGSGFSLVVGQAYFILLYADFALTIPTIQTLIYRERREGRDGIEFCFSEVRQDAEDSLFIVKEDDRDDLLVDRAGLIARLSDPEAR